MQEEKNQKFVEDLDEKDSWQEMDGETDLEKKLNHFLTKRFIVSKDVPSDECIREAREIIKMVRLDIWD